MLPRIPSGLAVLLSATTLLWSLSACAPKTIHRELSRHAPRLAEVPDGATLKAHLRNGDVVIFEQWRVYEDGRRVDGIGRRYDPQRAVLDEGNLSVSADSVAIFETDAVAMSSIGGFMAAVTVISIGISVYCVTNPKACFGSCPTFYRPTGDEADPWRLVAEGFSIPARATTSSA